MKTPTKILSLALIALSFVTPSVLAVGIPEPGLVLYGSVPNTASSFALMSGGVQWTASVPFRLPCGVSHFHVPALFTRSLVTK